METVREVEGMVVGLCVGWDGGFLLMIHDL